LPGLAVAGGNATRGISLPRGEWAYLQRHGDDGYTLPGAIDHERNMRRLLDAGCDRVLAIGSVGGLHPELGPGTVLCPDDFIALAAPSPTIHDDDRAHGVHGFDREWRRQLIESWSAAAGAPIVDGGVYWQTLGPRLETTAEVRMIAERAQVVGMTLGSECTVASELGLAYAAICLVTNFANGVDAHELSAGEPAAGAGEARARLEAALAAVLPQLA
jgi:5'-methylthioadenosine phosphorylase